MIEGVCHCGAVTWRFAGVPESATACNCTICRRYGVLWAYGHEGEDVNVAGPTETYVRGTALAFHFCRRCGCVVCWRSLRASETGARRIAVNLRLAEPGDVNALPVEHFDGLNTFDDLGQDGRTVAHMWF
ncbi:GFA family protein [bacterium]|nr:GFA family protein [bacterium]